MRRWALGAWMLLCWPAAPGDAREAEVADDDLRVGLLQGREALLAVGGDHYLEAPSGEKPAQQAPNDGVVIDHEDPVLHGVSSGAGSSLRSTSVFAPARDS